MTTAVTNQNSTANTKEENVLNTAAATLMITNNAVKRPRLVFLPANSVATHTKRNAMENALTNTTTVALMVNHGANTLTSAQNTVVKMVYTGATTLISAKNTVALTITPIANTQENVSPMTISAALLKTHTAHTPTPVPTSAANTTTKSMTSGVITRKLALMNATAVTTVKLPASVTQELTTLTPPVTILKEKNAALTTGVKKPTSVLMMKSPVAKLNTTHMLDQTVNTTKTNTAAQLDLPTTHSEFMVNTTS